MVSIIRKLEDRLSSEWIMMLLKVMKLMLLLLLINHYVGCTFYLIGNTGEENSWVTIYGLDVEHFALRYLTTLRWSLSQFTPSSSEIQPVNSGESLFATVVVLFGMVCFSSFVSSITSTVQQLSTYRLEHATEEHNLRQFLLHHTVSPDLCARIWDFIRISSSAAATGRTAEVKAKLLQELPHALIAETRVEVYAPSLTRHRVFQYLAEANLAAFYDTCYRALSQRAVPVNRELFLRGERCSKMFFMVEGALKYDKGIYPKVSMEDQRIISTSGTEARRLGKYVLEGDWLCEPALWKQRWEHKGSTVALSHVEAFELRAKTFVKATVTVPGIRTYMTKFLALCDSEQWDDLCYDVDFIEMIADEAFPVIAEKRTNLMSSSTSNSLLPRGLGFRPVRKLISFGSERLHAAISGFRASDVSSSGHSLGSNHSPKNSVHRPRTSPQESPTTSRRNSDTDSSVAGPPAQSTL